MRTIRQSDLRNQSAEILRQVESGEELTITVHGRPVAVLGPCPPRQWIPKAELLKILRTQAPDPSFFEDLKDLEGI